MKPDAEDEISEALERLLRLLRVTKPVDGLHPVQWEVLRYLARANAFSRSPSALARYLGVTKGTVSQTLIALERQGLVERKADPRDRRAKFVVLTEAGRRRGANDPWSALSGLAAALPKKERRRLGKGLTALLEALQQRAPAPAFGLCHACRHFEPLSGRNPLSAPHRCAFFKRPISDEESRLICVEQKPA